MSFVSACIVATSEEARFDRRVAYETALRANRMAKPDSRWGQFTLWRLAWAEFHIGERERAIATMKQALAGVRRLKTTHDFGDLESECEDGLRAFASASGK